MPNGNVEIRDYIEELTLLLLYLTSWKEKIKGMPLEDISPRSWKGYPFEALNELAGKGYILYSGHPSKAKSVGISKKGVDKAEELKRKYLILTADPPLAEKK